jgi:ubiquinone biosynthesis protein
MLFESLTRMQENAGRLREILTVLGRYGLADWLARRRVGWIRKLLLNRERQRLGELRQEERIRLALLELGTTFIKLGQMLSTRPELVGPELAAELSKLQSSTPPDPPEVVRKTIEAELGQPPEKLFEEFSFEALASASIAQVHRARLPGGQAVVVKVQHEGIEKTIQRDLSLLLGLAELAQNHIAALRNYRPVATVREFRRTLLRELDLTRERRNLEEFARHFAGDETVHFPAVYPERCSRRVLTMEYLEGIPGSAAAALPPGTVDLVAFARRAGNMYLNMIFRDGFYHADPHPGNYLILPGKQSGTEGDGQSVVGVLDCGMVGRLDDGLREQIEAMLLAVVEHDVEEMADRVMQIGSPPPDLDRPALRADLAEFVAEYGAQAIRDLDFGAALNEMIHLIARHRIVLPAEAAMLLRALVLLDGTARNLDPTFSLIELLEDYQKRNAWRRLIPRRWLGSLPRTSRDYDRLFRLLPRELTQILERLRSGTFESRHQHRRLEASVNRLAFAILTGSVVLGSALLLGHATEHLPRFVLPVLGIAGFALAGFLGLLLVLSRTKGEDSDSRR